MKLPAASRRFESPTREVIAGAPEVPGEVNAVSGASPEAPVELLAVAGELLAVAGGLLGGRGVLAGASGDRLRSRLARREAKSRALITPGAARKGSATAGDLRAVD